MWDSSLDGFTGFGTAQASFTISLSPRRDQRELGVDVPVRVAWIPTEEDQILSDFTSSRVSILERSVAVLTNGSADGVSSLSCQNILDFVLSDHIDDKSRFLDFTTDKFVVKFMEFRDAVVSISIDPLRDFCVATGRVI